MVQKMKNISENDARKELGGRGGVRYLEPEGVKYIFSSKEKCT